MAAVARGGSPVIVAIATVAPVAPAPSRNWRREIDCDVLVAADDKDARAIGIEMARHAGLRGIDVGVLANSVVAESLTSVLISINRLYKVPDSGIRITGLPAE